MGRHLICIPENVTHYVDDIRRKRNFQSRYALLNYQYIIPKCAVMSCIIAQSICNGIIHIWLKLLYQETRSVDLSLHSFATCYGIEYFARKPCMKPRLILAWSRQGRYSFALKYWLKFQAEVGIYLYDNMRLNSAQSQ